MVLPLLLAACSAMPIDGAPPPRSAITGDWGGDHIGLHLTGDGGTIDYDCASGTIAAIVPTAGGTFAATGTHTPGQGGPVREGEVMPTYGASFSGRVSGDRMSLQALTSNGVALGPFELRRGAEAGIFRCL